MLMPLFLTGARDFASWRRRLLIGAAIVATVIAAFGIGCTIFGEDWTRAVIGPFLPAGVPATTDLVLKCISLWRFAGLAAVITLLFVAWRPSPRASVVVLGLLAFAALGPICLSIRELSSVGGIPKDLRNWTGVAAMPLTAWHPIAASLLPVVIAIRMRRAAESHTAPHDG
jgi:hypothetical protein